MNHGIVNVTGQGKVFLQFIEESIAAGNLMREMVQTQEAEELAKIKETGVQVTKPDLEKFKELMGPAYERVSEYSGEENMKTFLSFIGK